MTNSPFQLTARATDSVRSLQPIVFAFGRLGDMVMLSAALNLLRERFGRRCLLVGAGPWNSVLFQGHADVERVLSFPRHVPFMLSCAWWRLLIALQQAGPGPVYVCERSPRQLSRIQRMLAVATIDPQRCLFVGDVAGEADHWVDSYVRLGHLTPAAVESPGDPSALGKNAAPRLYVSEAERLERDAWLQARGWLGRPLVLVQPGNFRTMSKRRDEWRRLNKDDKSWPIENWVALSQRVLARLPDVRVVLCGAPQEGGLLREIVASAGSSQIAAAELGLRQLMALSESAHSMISVDTGPAHVAAALGLPLVVLFGSQPQHVWLPRSSSGSSVLGLGGPPRSNRVDQIPMNEVFDAWCSLTA
ncbi:MAG: glycosyltransferase family 9 protein [Proteobacteria bacterium]|nr:glycosyltransferase family 9 protein [Pseudomonadota bacterium]